MQNSIVSGYRWTKNLKISTLNSTFVVELTSYNVRLQNSIVSHEIFFIVVDIQICIINLKSDWRKKEEEEKFDSIRSINNDQWVVHDTYINLRAHLLSLFIQTSCKSTRNRSLLKCKSIDRVRSFPIQIELLFSFQHPD